MAGPYYVRSSDGDDASNGLSWANAKATLTGALAVAVGGERIWVSQAHAESTAGAITLTASGSTAASPIEILCGNDAAEPPTELATTATIATSGNVAINIGTGFAYWYGLSFLGSTGAQSGAFLAIGQGALPIGHVFDTCTFQIRSTNTGNRIRLGAAAGSSNDDVALEFRGCYFTFGHTSQAFELRYGRIKFIGGVAPSGGSVPTAEMFETETSMQSWVRGYGIDFSAASGSLVGVNGDGPADILFANIKTHASMTPVMGTNPGPGGPVVRLHNYGSGDTNYRFYESQYQGTAQDETTIVRTGGASDGTTALAWKMVSTANVKFYDPLYSPEIVLWNDTTGSRTFTIEVVTDNVTLTDGDAWLELEYLGTSGFPLSIHGSDRKTNILTTAANQDSSSETWTTTGLTTPVKQKFVSPSLTIHEKGPVRLRVALAKASTTMYVCPKVTVA